MEELEDGMAKKRLMIRRQRLLPSTEFYVSDFTWVVSGFSLSSFLVEEVIE